MHRERKIVTMVHFAPRFIIASSVEPIVTNIEMGVDPDYSSSVQSRQDLLATLHR